MDDTYVDDFREIKTEDVDFEDEPMLKRKRGAPRVWQKVAEFQTPEEAEENIRSRFIWKKASSKTGREGTRVEYRCSAGKYRVNECPAGLYLLYHSTSTKVSLFETECRHDNHNPGPARGLSVELKNFVKGLFEEGVQKPNAILAAIRRENFAEPAKAKLISFLKLLRVEKYGQATVSAAEIQTWCDTKKGVPSGDDEPFVLDYLIQADTKSTDDQDLKILLSTKRLLSNLKKSSVIQTDATFTLFWQGYPIIVIGTSDKNQVFHPIGVAVCKDVAADDFNFIFRTLQKFESGWNPSILLADGSAAITDGFKNVFGEPQLRIQCFSQVFRNLEKVFKGLKNDVSTFNQLKNDIHAIQTCGDGSSYKKAMELFLLKWKGSHGYEMDEFIQRFEEQCMSKGAVWYEGAALGCPSTNSAVDALLKNERTHIREKLPVDQFLDNLVQMVSKWSKSRDPKSANPVQFADNRTITVQQWTTAYQWAAKNIKVLQQNNENPNVSIFLANSSALQETITPEVASKYNESEGKWESFEDFQKMYYGTWKIILNKENLESSKCTCPYFSKHSSCKHVLGMQIRLHLVSPPNEAKVVATRKRGRPSLHAKRALLT